jgi:hypothetical protein
MPRYGIRPAVSAFLYASTKVGEWFLFSGCCLSFFLMNNFLPVQT